MRIVLDNTESLCPICLTRLPAAIVGDETGVYLEKKCPTHGLYRTIIWRDSPASYQKWLHDAGKAGESHPSGPHCDSKYGCPFDCGLCPSHVGESCTAALMVTNRCNLNCPVCFTECRNEEEPETSIDELEKGLCFYLETSGKPFPLELCGGEPTVRDDLPDIILMARKMGFSHIQINSNGIRLAQEPELAYRLKDAGATVIYLSFDGIDDNSYKTTVGKPILSLKMKAIENCATAGLAVVLVPVLIPNINIHQVGDIISLAKSWLPHVKGVHFQPISYFGKYLNLPRNEDRLTIPDIINMLAEQTGGELKPSDFMPPGCEHPLCSFQALYIKGADAKLKALTKRQARTNNNDAAKHVRAIAPKQWCASPMPTLTVGGMLFQDVWNIDLARLKRCGIHIITKKQGLIPLCAKYLTAQDGKRLYPRIS
ncbi:MAG TPA: radical SAM protein [Syntrophomonadaceae bacterium]|nr:radical SAM protein [Syntrophomonadaceae bacterium]